MDIRCNKCNHTEETSLGFFVKLIGGAMPVGGFWAWTAYIFAGTGMAMPIVVAIISGGTAMLIFKDEIVQWISNRGFECPNCGSTDWAV